MKIQDVELHLECFGASIAATNATLESDQARLERHLSLMLAGERQAPFKWREPSSWWQHFKKERFPKWLLRRYPVNETEHEVDVATVYPFLKTQLPVRLQGERVLVRIASEVVGSFLPDTNGMVPDQWRERAVSLLQSERYAKDGVCPCCQRSFIEIAWKFRSTQ